VSARLATRRSALELTHAQRSGLDRRPRRRVNPGARIAKHRCDEGLVHGVEAWFAWENESDQSQLIVHIGFQRVGVLTASGADAYRPILQAAAERDELPWTNTLLTHLLGPEPYLLTVPLPTPA
jgi:hypothetical protein